MIQYHLLEHALNAFGMRFDDDITDDITFCIVNLLWNLRSQDPNKPLREPVSGWTSRRARLWAMLLLLACYCCLHVTVA
jgi:hypothetical protein